MGITVWKRRKAPDLSVIVVMYNMRREARRTLYSLAQKYQRDPGGKSYEVIVLDNGSEQPLEPAWVHKFGDNFRYEYFEARNPSPCAALNYGAQIARGKWVTLCIDGARILSPGILHFTMLASKTCDDPFIYTLAMHLGHKLQNHLAQENYSRADEDRLLASVDWEQDGYRLFDVSTVAGSSGKGYFSTIQESNCLTVRRSTFQAIGGLDERFDSPGGGLANLDLFNRLNEMDDLTPILLLGEATFHQYHGGTATNVPVKDHPWDQMAAEYARIRGKPYAVSFRQPVFFGNVHPRSKRLLCPPQEK